IILTKAGNAVKKILLKLNVSDHRKLKDGGEGRYEHANPVSLKAQDGGRSHGDEQRLCLVDDFKAIKFKSSTC
nr:hypothetical protein [Tanacetum cinerariifolium]